MKTRLLIIEPMRDTQEAQEAREAREARGVSAQGMDLISAGVKSLSSV
jgi:hypothetical protein